MKEKINVEVHFSGKEYSVKVFDLAGKPIEKLNSYGLRNKNVANAYVERLKISYMVESIQYKRPGQENDARHSFQPEYVAHAFEDTVALEEFLENLFLHKKGYALKIDVDQDSEYLSFSLSEENSIQSLEKAKEIFSEVEDIQDELFEALFDTVAVNYDVSAKDWGNIYLMIPFGVYTPIR